MPAHGNERYQTPPEADDQHLLRVVGGHQKGCIGFVSGSRRRSRLINPVFSPSPENAFKSDNGRASLSTGVFNRPRTAFQKGLLTKPFCHHSRQRSTVRRLAPTSSRSIATRFGVAPCLSAETRTTTAATNTFRPRNRNEAGVRLRRQPSRSQQKLNRLSYLSSSPGGSPRGLRGYLALCRDPLQGQPPLLQSAAISSSS